MVVAIEIFMNILFRSFQEIFEPSLESIDFYKMHKLSTKFEK